MQTRALFEKCVGLIFHVIEVRSLDAPPYQLLQLDVGVVLGKAPCMETIWIEPQYVELAPED